MPDRGTLVGVPVTLKSLVLPPLHPLAEEDLQVSSANLVQVERLANVVLYGMRLNKIPSNAPESKDPPPRLQR